VSSAVARQRLLSVERARVQNWSEVTLSLAYKHPGTDHIENSSIVACNYCVIKNLLPSNGRCSVVCFAGTCLPSHCPETAEVYPPIPLSLHSNGSTCYSIIFSGAVATQIVCVRLFVASDSSRTAGMCHDGVGGNGYINPHFLDLGTSWRSVVSFTPLPLYPEKRAHRIHWIGGWVGPRAGLHTVEKRNILILPGLELRPLGRSAHSQSLYRLRHPGPYLTKVSIKISKVL
jgi:hypothetical protein